MFLEKEHLHESIEASKRYQNIFDDSIFIHLQNIITQAFFS